MNAISGLAWVGIWHCACACCCAQTNACAASAVRFYLPPLQLRMEAREEPARTASVSSSPTSNLSVAAVDTFELDNFSGAGEFRSGVIRSGEFYLTKPESKSDSAMVRAVEGIFTPEIIHLGKTPMSCSVIAAIKRKNPLCLLNPIFFQMSW